MTDLVALAERTARAIEASGDARPFAFAGMCMGAVVAFETARRLARAPSRLVVMSSGSPQDMDTFRVPEALLVDLEGRDDEALLRMGLEAGLLREYVSDEMASLGPDELARALSAVLPTRLLVSDMLSEHRYRFAPGAPLACPLTVLSGDDPERGALTEAQLVGWREVTAASCAFTRVAGGHYIASVDGREHRWGRADVLERVREALGAP